MSESIVIVILCVVLHVSSLMASVEHQLPEQQSKLPPDMADYRLAALTAKTTPPIPRRRIIQDNRHDQRPSISAPIHIQLLPGFDDRRPVPELDSTNAGSYRFGPLNSWNDSLPKSDAKTKKKTKVKKPSKISSNFNVLPCDGPYTQQYRHQEDLNITPEYPGLEYPPVFEPGTYTLNDFSYGPRRNADNQNQYHS